MMYSNLCLSFCETVPLIHFSVLSVILPKMASTNLSLVSRIHTVSGSEDGPGLWQPHMGADPTGPPPYLDLHTDHQLDQVDQSALKV